MWREDVLGAGFMCRTIPLGADDEGTLDATLVRSVPTEDPQLGMGLRELAQYAADGATRLFAGVRKMFHVKHSSAWPAGMTKSTAEAASAAGFAENWQNIDVLYVHGWSDYFFNRELARFFTARGARFYALDLRKYGRSLHPGQTPGYITDLASYDTEISAAISIIRADKHGLPGQKQSRLRTGTESERLLLLFGHSTGGLVLSLWAAAHPGEADGLLLNSPWLEFQLRGAGRQLISPFVELSARINPREIAPQLDFGFYTKAQQEVGPQEVLRDINHKWRPAQTNTVLSGWLNAILAGHSRVAAGLDLDIPACVLLSARSLPPVRWSSELTRADTVLDVDAVAQAALRLGDTVTVIRIKDALHDVYLSGAVARSLAYQRTAEWVTAWQLVCGGHTEVGS